MRAQTFNAATKLAVSTVACALSRVQGYFKHTADAWLQIHDSYGEPAAGAVPAKVYALPYNAPYSWAFDPGSLTLTKGCYVAVSSTEGTYTTIAYNAGVTFCDIEADFGPYSFKPTDYTVTTDTGQYGITVWADGTIGHLYYVSYTNGEAVEMYVHIYTAAPVEGVTIPFMSFGPVAAGETLELFFGAEGVSPVTRAAGVAKTGCQISQSSQPLVYSGSEDNNGSDFIAHSK